MTRTLLDRTREHLLSCHLDLAASALQLRLRQLAFAPELRSDPDQPRHPAGTPEGGRWSGDTAVPTGTSEAVGSGGVGVDSAGRFAKIRATSTVLTDNDGNEVRNIYGEQILFPNEMPPSFFIEKGETNRCATVMYDSNDIESHLIDSNIAVASMDAWSDRVKFRIGGEWDAQRIRGGIHSRAQGLCIDWDRSIFRCGGAEFEGCTRSIKYSCKV